MDRDTLTEAGGAENDPQSAFMTPDSETGSSNETVPVYEVDMNRWTAVTADKYSSDIYKIQREPTQTQKQLTILKSRVQDQEGSLEDIFSQVDSLTTEVNEIHHAMAEYNSILEERRDDHGSLEERVTQVEDGLGNMKATIEADQVNLRTVEFIYRGVMVTGLAASIVAAVALGLTYQLVTVGVVLLLVSAFFAWSYKRGLQPANVW